MSTIPTFPGADRLLTAWAVPPPVAPQAPAVPPDIPDAPAFPPPPLPEPPRPVFNPGVQLDPSQVDDRRGQPPDYGGDHFPAGPTPFDPSNPDGEPDENASWQTVRGAAPQIHPPNTGDAGLSAAVLPRVAADPSVPEPIPNGPTTPVTPQPLPATPNGTRVSYDPITAPRPMDPHSAFIAEYQPYAEQASRELGIPSNVLLGWGASESNWGAAGSIFGIKAEDGDPNSQEYDTWEAGPNGERVPQRARFKTYANPGEAFGHLKQELNTPRYKPALDYIRQTGDVHGFLQRIQQAGYATDTNWPAGVLALAKQINGGSVQPSGIGSGPQSIRPPNTGDGSMEGTPALDAYINRLHLDPSTADMYPHELGQQQQDSPAWEPPPPIQHQAPPVSAVTPQERADVTTMAEEMLNPDNLMAQVNQARAQERADTTTAAEQMMVQTAPGAQTSLEREKQDTITYGEQLLRADMPELPHAPPSANADALSQHLSTGNVISGQDNVDAPSGTLRAKLEAGRGGSSTYSTLTDPKRLAAAAPLLIGILQPSAIAAMALQQGAAENGAPPLVQDILAVAPFFLGDIGPEAAAQGGARAIAKSAATRAVPELGTAAEQGLLKARGIVGSAVGLNLGGKVDSALGLPQIPGIGGPAALLASIAGGHVATSPTIQAAAQRLMHYVTPEMRVGEASYAAGPGVGGGDLEGQMKAQAAADAQPGHGQPAPPSMTVEEMGQFVRGMGGGMRDGFIDMVERRLTAGESMSKSGIAEQYAEAAYKRGFTSRADIERALQEGQRIKDSGLTGPDLNTALNDSLRNFGSDGAAAAAPSGADAAPAAATPLTPDAQALLDQIDRGGSVPAFSSNNLLRIARENGLAPDEYNAMTPNEIIDALRAKGTGSAGTPHIPGQTGLFGETVDTSGNVVAPPATPEAPAKPAPPELLAKMQKPAAAPGPGGGDPSPPAASPPMPPPSVEALQNGDPVEKIIANLQGAGAVRPDLIAARRAELGKRVTNMVATLQNSGLSPTEAATQARQRLRGQLADPAFAQDVPLTDADVQALQARINAWAVEHPGQSLSSLPATEGLNKLQAGVIPAPHEVQALGTILGPRLQSAIEQMGEVWKVHKSAETKLLMDPIEVPINIGEGEAFTADILAGMLKKNMPKGTPDAVLQTVAQRLLDGEKIRMVMRKDGTMVATIGEGTPHDATGQAVEQAVRGLSGEKMDFPSDYPLTPTPRELPGTEAAGRELFSAEPVPNVEKPPEGASLGTQRLNRGLLTSSEGPRGEGPAQDATSGLLPGPLLEAGPTSGPLKAGEPEGPLMRAQREEMGRNPAAAKRLPPLEVQEPNAFWHIVSNLPSLPKAFLATLDRSAVLRQGGLLIRRGAQVRDAISKTMIIAEDAADAARLRERMHLPDSWEFANAQDVMDQLNGRKWAEVSKKAGLIVEEYGTSADPAKRNENFASELAGWIPGAKMSERAYTVYLNKLRADVFDSTVEKWLRDGRSFLPDARKPITQEDLAGLATYLNTATGHGSLGGFERAASAMSKLWFSPRQMASRFEVIGQLFSPSTPYLVRKEMAKDLSVYVGTGMALLSMAKLSGLADVELDPRSSDFGKMRIGNTRIDWWGGYSQIAALLAREITGQTKSSDGEIRDAGRLDVGLRYLRNKLAPAASTGVSLLDEKDTTGQPFSPLSWDTAYKTFVPLFLQDSVDAYKEQGLAGLAFLPAGFFGLGMQTYKTTADIRNEAANKLLPGAKYKDLSKSQQDAINKSPAVTANQGPPSDLKVAAETTKAAILAKQTKYEDAFKAGNLDGGKTLPDRYAELGHERLGAAEAFQADFASTLSGIPQDRIGKITEPYYNKEAPTNADGSPDFDKTASLRADYVKSLSDQKGPHGEPSDREIMTDYITWVEGQKSVTRQKYDAYIDARKAAGYFDIAIDDPKRTQKLAALDAANPDQDVANWVWKGGVPAANGGKTPSLNSTAAAQQALSLNLPNRPVKLANMDRPLNFSPETKQAWSDTRRYLDALPGYVAANSDAEATRLYAKKYAALDTQQQSTVRSNVLANLQKADPQTDAVLAFWGRNDTLQSEAAKQYLLQMVTKYKLDPAKDPYLAKLKVSATAR